MRWASTPDPWDRPQRKLPKAALKQRLEKQRAAAAAAEAAGDLAAAFEARCAQAEAHRDLEQWRPAIAAWQAALALLPEDAPLDERVGPHAFASAAAYELEDWATALSHALTIDGLAGAADSDEHRQVATFAVVEVRKKIGLKRFTELFGELLETIPEALRGHIRAEEHLHPTVTRPDA